MVSPNLLEKIHRTVVNIPPSVLESLIHTLQNSAESGYEQIRHNVLKHIPTPEFRDTINELLEAWQTENDISHPQALALSLASAAHSYRTAREQTAIELVWTGPTTGVIPLRRTEQVLIEMIREARQELLIVSFAVYDIEEIVTEMERALARGVGLTIVIETPDSSQGKIYFGADASLNDKIKAKARILKWPYEKREKDENGKYGSLHAKCAVMDRDSVLISSANLTQYALNLNMEMGLRVKDKILAEKIVRHYEVLTQLGVLS
ncbi:MAG: DISARM system phospholipase D-like protein DrmC [Acidobacteria bacterium]|nr:DISARM system phospholipase D-like protein DrmC [Acidobacteriota bacterium]MCI0663555.1 DISARM system phospholipase D-like protein DrmC [Acidobacteriota bacterium]